MYKNTESNKYLSNSLLSETHNGFSKNISQPKITSTPLHSEMRRAAISATPPKSSPLNPKRYFLSEEATPSRMSTSKGSNVKVDARGPLLASTRLNESISTYEDTKSPGLTERLLRYSEDVQKEHQRPSTHQEKYKSLGQFPIVHLFKKKLPVKEQRNSVDSIRIPSLDRSRYHSQEYNRKLLEGIIRPSSFSSLSASYQDHENSTRSVLDALKEISSRKRIHSNEEFDLEEDSGKRFKTDRFNSSETQKRMRDDSPSLDRSSSPNKQSTKRVCVYDEYAASRSSMDFSFLNKSDNTAKRKSTSTITENSNEEKQIKLVNVETQTIEPEKKTNIENSEKHTDKTDSREVKKKDSILKVFDNQPLEKIRKNRLAALMGTLAGKEEIPVNIDRNNRTILQEVPDETQPVRDKNIPNDKEILKETGVQNTSKTSFSLSSNLINTSNTTTISEREHNSEFSSPSISTVEKPLTSILTKQKKISPAKSDKHVHFNIPESTKSLSFSPVTQTSIAISTPIISTTVKESTQLGTKHVTESERPISTASPVFKTSTNISTPLVLTSSSNITVPSFSFGSKSPSSPKNESFGAPQSVVLSSKEQISVLHSHSLPSLPSSKPTVSSSPIGGFKFDLSKPAVPNTLDSDSRPVSAMSGSSNQSSTGSLTTKNNFTISMPETSGKSISSSTPGPMFNFVNKSDDSNKLNSLLNNQFSQGAAFPVTTNSLSKSPTFNFGSKMSNTAVSNALSHTMSPGSNSTTFGGSSKPLFGNDLNTFTTSTTTSNTSVDLHFKGPVKTEQNTINSSLGTGSLTTTNFSSLGTSNNIFGNPTSNQSFGNNSQVSGDTKNSPFSFTSKSNSITDSSPSFSFGTKTTESSTFGSNNTGPITTANFSFTPTTSFGTAKNSSTNGTSTSLNFGSTQSNASPFAAPASTSNGFSLVSTPNTQTNIFGNTSAVVPFGTSSPFSSSIQQPSIKNDTVTTTFGSFGESSNSSFSKPQTSNISSSAPTASFNPSNQPTAIFGSTSVSTTHNNATFNFSSPNVAKPSSSMFSFGSGSNVSSDAPKPGFNFTANSSNQPPVFGTSTSFVAGGQPTFGAASVPQFNAPPTGAAPGIFNIGAGSSGRRIQKAKRRT